ncbi:hypothetical protein E2I00_013973, partial [Balaenoptera physalus]
SEWTGIQYTYTYTVRVEKPSDKQEVLPSVQLSRVPAGLPECCPSQGLWLLTSGHLVLHLGDLWQGLQMTQQSLPASAHPPGSLYLSLLLPAGQAYQGAGAARPGRSEAGRHPEPLFADVCFPPGRISGAASGREGGRSGSRLRALRLPLQMLLLPPRPPHPRSSSPETMDPPPPKAPPFPKTEGPRKGYSCPECARVFASPLRLQSHRVSHSDLKPFTCGACGKAFKRSSHLSRHRATHRARAGPPHTCPLCPRRFQDAAELAQHVRLH